MQTEARLLATTDGGRRGGERRGVGSYVGRATEPRWELQMVGGVKECAVR